MNHKSKNSEQAAVFLELAISVIVLLSLSIGAFELSKILKIQQKMSLLSSEAAREAFRSCSSGQASNITTCLNALQANLNSTASAILPGAEVVLSVYRYRIPSNSQPNRDYVQLQHISGVVLSDSDPNTAGRTTSGQISKYTPPLDPLHNGHPNPMSDFFVRIPPLGNTLFPPNNPPVPNFPIGSITRTNQWLAIAEVFYRYTPSVTPNLKYFQFFSKNLYEHTIY